MLSLDLFAMLSMHLLNGALLRMFTSPIVVLGHPHRNQVLNDALSRLTSSDAYPAVAGTGGSTSAFSTTLAGGGANGFPTIPRLMDRGRELAASLGGEQRVVLKTFGMMLSHHGIAASFLLVGVYLILYSPNLLSRFL